jgi:TIR domain
MADIFISFIHEEEAVAVAVQQLLRAFLGNRNVFLSADEWQIFAGEQWLDRIKSELQPAKVVVLLLSPRSVQRPWVNFEAGAAWLTGKVIVPACFAGLSKGTLPKPYSNIQHQISKRLICPMTITILFGRFRVI